LIKEFSSTAKWWL